MTGWQDSFQPVQAQSQGWQSSFQPTQPSLSEDIGKSAASGLAKDASYAMNPMGIVRNIGNPVVGGATRLAGAAYEAMGGELPLGMAKWMTNPLGDGNDITSQVQNQILPAAVQAKTGMNMNYQPQTGIGQATQTTTEALPYLIGAEGSIPQVMARAAGVGGGSELGKATASGMGFGDKGQQVGQTLGGSLGYMTPEMLTPAPKLPISPAIKDTLFNGSPDVRTYAGEDLAQKLSGAEQNAYTNKEQAYQAAADPAKQVTLAPNHVTNLANSIEASTKDFNPNIVKNVGGVQDIVNAMRDDIGKGGMKIVGSMEGVPMEAPNPQTPLNWARVDQARQELYNLPKANDAEAAVRAKALSAYHDFTNDLLQKGIVEGDPSALSLIKDANSKNAAWRKQFTGNDANKAISDFIDKQGGIDSIAPEVLLDKFTKVGQAGFDNVRAAQQVLGDEANPILKQGYLDKLRSASMDQNGEFVPAKLQKNINTLLTKNPSLVKSVFSPAELEGLQGISDTAGRYAKTGAKPGVLGRVTLKIPIAKQLFGGSINAAAKAKMMNKIQNPRQK